MRSSTIQIMQEHDITTVPLPGVLNTILSAGKNAGKIQYYEIDAWTLEICLRNEDQTWRVIRANISDYMDLLGGSSKDILMNLFLDNRRRAYGDLMTDIKARDPNRWESYNGGMHYLLARMCLVYVHNIRLGSKLKLLSELVPCGKLRLDDNITILPRTSSFTALQLCALLYIPYEDLPTLLGACDDHSCNNAVAWRLKAGI
jgi:hypothetical protein